MKLLLGIGAPVLGFGFWGLVDFHQAGRLGEPLRLVQELAITGLAAVALYVAGQHALGWAMAILSVINHALVYISGDTLLKQLSNCPHICSPRLSLRAGVAPKQSPNL